MRATDNPFESPKTELEPERPTLASGSDEQVRRELLNHEASIKSVGRLNILGGVLAIIVGFAMLADTDPELPAVGATAIFVAIGLVTGWIGNKLRTLDPRGRLPAALLHAVGLLGFPFGTLVSGYVLWLVLSEKGRRVLSTEYQGVVARTPHVRYKTPVLIVALAVLVIGSVVATMVMALLG